MGMVEDVCRVDRMLSKCSDSDDDDSSNDDDDDDDSSSDGEILQNDLNTTLITST